MRYPQHTATLPDLEVEQEPSSAFLTQCHRNALERLSHDFSEKRPLAILIGDGKSAARFVIRKFLSRLDHEVAVARIAEPCAHSMQLMQKVITAVGFQPKDMSLDDLESIFSMFLSFQKAHRRRTIICVEDAQDCEWWVLDKIRNLIERERENKYGLMFILSGQSGFKDLLNAQPLSSICAYAGRPISLAPFTLAETREFMRRRVEAAGRASLDQAFEYHAIPLVHELCGGIPDAIGLLVNQCLDVANDEGLELVTKELVKRAYESLRAASEQHEADDEAATVNVTGIQPRTGRLIIRLKGDEVRELAVRQGHILIGRSKICDVRVDSKIVSRHHALISYSPGGATIVDLGSTNGTYVDGYGIKEHALVAGETIAVGDCRIEYMLGNDLQTHIQNAGQSPLIEARSKGH